VSGGLDVVYGATVRHRSVLDWQRGVVQQLRGACRIVVRPGLDDVGGVALWTRQVQSRRHVRLPGV
jgi:hypothetical protein